MIKIPTKLLIVNDDVQVRFQLAELREQQGDGQAAILEYERIVSIGSDDAVILNNLAWLYAKSGNAEALPMAQRAHSLQPDNAAITDTLGWLKLKNGDLRGALKLLEIAADNSPDNPEIKYHLADALAQSGELDRARSILAEIIGTATDFPARADAERLAESI